jgi:hypothetical protein
MFSIQRTANRPKYSHTFATFVKAAGDGDSFENYRFDVITISWLPETLDIHVCRRRPEPGTLVNLPATLGWAEANGARISMWGPFQIQKELYERAVVRATLLEGGSIGYNAIDRRRRPNDVDCIHALSGVDVDPGLFRTRTAHGDIGSYFVLEHLSRWIIQPGEIPPAVERRLRLDDFCIVRRDLNIVPRSVLPFHPPYYDRSSPQASTAAASPTGVETPTTVAPESKTPAKIPDSKKK